MKIAIIASIFLSAGAVLFSGCTSTSTLTTTSVPEPVNESPSSFANTGNSSANPLSDKSWILKQVVSYGQSIEIPPHAQTGLIFRSSGEVNGRAGVNAFYGHYSIDNMGNIAWDSRRFATTRMAGPRPLIEFEAEFLRALQRSSNVRLEQDRMILSGTGVHLEFISG